MFKSLKARSRYNMFQVDLFVFCMSIKLCIVKLLTPLLKLISWFFNSWFFFWGIIILFSLSVVLITIMWLIFVMDYFLK